jgi:hypothetical protein
VSFQAILAGAEVHAAARGPAPSLSALRQAPAAMAYEALRKLVAERPGADVGVPIAFTARYLVDGQAAALAFAASYQQVRCTPLPDRPYALVLTGSNVDKELYVYLENGTGNELLLYSNQRGGGTVSLNQALDRHGASDGVIQMKIGNADCFHTSGTLAITVDGVQRWKIDMDKLLSDCGWQLEAKVRVSEATGTLEELYRWVK